MMLEVNRLHLCSNMRNSLAASTDFSFKLKDFSYLVLFFSDYNKSERSIDLDFPFLKCCLATVTLLTV